MLVDRIRRAFFSLHRRVARRDDLFVDHKQQRGGRHRQRDDCDEYFGGLRIENVLLHRHRKQREGKLAALRERERQ